MTDSIAQRIDWILENERIDNIQVNKIERDDQQNDLKNGDVLICVFVTKNIENIHC